MLEILEKQKIEMSLLSQHLAVKTLFRQKFIHHLHKKLARSSFAITLKMVHKFPSNLVVATAISTEQCAL